MAWLHWIWWCVIPTMYHLQAEQHPRISHESISAEHGDKADEWDVQHPDVAHPVNDELHQEVRDDLSQCAQHHPQTHLELGAVCKTGSDVITSSSSQLAKQRSAFIYTVLVRHEAEK